MLTGNKMAVWQIVEIYCQLKVDTFPMKKTKIKDMDKVNMIC